MSFWEKCETLTFGRLLGGVPCTTDSDCYVGVCSRTNSTCSYTKDQGETGFVQVRVCPKLLSGLVLTPSLVLMLAVPPGYHEPLPISLWSTK